MAERSIDAQYCFVLGDTTWRLFVERLLAAERVGRVRLLLDELKTKAHDPGRAALESPPFNQVRVFSPFAYRGLRALDFLGDFGRAKRRIRNKSFTVDNRMAIVGGRSIGDEYFDAR